MRENFVGRCDVLLFRRRKFCQTCYACRPFRRKSAEPFRQLVTINRTKETSKLGSRRRAALSVRQSSLQSDCTEAEVRQSGYLTALLEAVAVKQCFREPVFM